MAGFDFDAALRWARFDPRKTLARIELCNGLEHTTFEARINGCTSLIDASQGTATTLAIAYNNRGNAYAAKADCDRAIQDFDQSIKLNPTYTKPFSRGRTAPRRMTRVG